MKKRSGLGKDCRIFKTFHSWALALLTQEAAHLPFKVKRDLDGKPDFLILAPPASKIIRDLCGGYKVPFKDAKNFVSLWKRSGITPQEAFEHAETDQEENAAQVYRKYQYELERQGLLDFDDLVIQAAELLETNEDVRNRHQYRFVQVDEAQDTDALQWRVIKAISEQHGNVLAVGDENQGMYSWRGSMSNLTEYFTALYPNAKVFPLPVNYRSTKNIVAYVKQIAPIKNEMVEVMHTPNGHGSDPEFRLFPIDAAEADFIIGSVSDPAQTAVLVRTNRQLAEFERACQDRNMNYHLLGKSGFWGQPEVKGVVALVQTLVAPTNASIATLLESRTDLTKFIRKETVRKLKEYATQNECSIGKLLETYETGNDYQDRTLRELHVTCKEMYSSAELRSMPCDMAMEMVYQRFGVLSAWDQHEAENATDDKANFDNEPVRNVEKIKDFAKRHKTLTDFYDFTERVRKARLLRSNRLTLSTIHQAKGKEWNTVFVAGVNLDVLPHIKGDPDEEARIYHVACSRAALRLNVSASGIPSEYIREHVHLETAAETFFLEAR